MKKPFIKIDAGNFELLPYPVYPTEGHEFPKNETTGKAFPYCCEFHQSIYEWAKEQYKEKEYQDLPDKVINQLSFTEHCIKHNINKLDWYKAITDYIEYNVYSFGQPQPRLIVDLYLRNVQSVIEGTGLGIDKGKQQKLIEFIEHYYQPDKHPEIDLNVLHSIYQEWLQIFPFGLNSYFGNLKQHFEKQLPFILGKPEVNIYTGWAKAKMHTKESLIEALVSLTKSLLDKINVPELIEKGTISDINKHRLELANESLKLGTAQLIKGFSEGELQYINMLKGWLQLNKDYFNEIAPLVQTNTPKQLPPQPEQQAPEIKPTFKPEAIPTILDLLKGFFSPEDQTRLEQILETGNNATEKLLFRDNGNKLTDTFKKLFEFYFITGCQKQDLQEWIIQNFTFLKQGKVSSFKKETVGKSISRNSTPCKSPIIEIKNGHIIKAEQPRQKKYTN